MGFVGINKKEMEAVRFIIIYKNYFNIVLGIALHTQPLKIITERDIKISSIPYFTETTPRL